MKKIKVLLSVLAIFLGIFFFIFGGYDDSPGAQLIGVVAVILSTVSIARNRK